DKIGLLLGYDESLAHHIEAGVDMFIMPSRFEPCGLNQLYSLRYGTVPIVNDTGGLADSVIDTNLETLENGVANGFKFYHPFADDLLKAVGRALDYYADPETWSQIQLNGMAADNSWSNSAQKYVLTYQKAMESQGDTNANLSV
ncbi:MAG: glycogen synthase GlgA, partial [Gammaproteobacteria bacterium]|nr:glycogen synthase GlgA [Gammaproteobacteria bacterium]